jgi:hypothetical protein
MEVRVGKRTAQTKVKSQQPFVYRQGILKRVQRKINPKPLGNSKGFHNNNLPSRYGYYVYHDVHLQVYLNPINIGINFYTTSIQQNPNNGNNNNVESSTIPTVCNSRNCHRLQQA